MTISGRYYSEFKGATFVIQAEDEAVENPTTTLAILRGASDLLAHGIRVLLVFGKGTEFEDELRTSFGARPHPETNRLVLPETALTRIREERNRILRVVEELCETNDIPSCVLPESTIRVERRIAHGSTGVVTEVKTQAIQVALNEQKLVILGFGGEDGRGRFLHVPSVSLAADLAVELDAQKLLFLMHADGITVADRKGIKRPLSFADLEGLLCLLQRTTPAGEVIVSGEVLPKVHASIRAVAGGVNQVHLVSYSRLLDEVLTRTGVGTMIERRQSHHVDYAEPEDLDEIERLHIESQRYISPSGTPYVKPLDRSELERLLPQTFLLRHRGVVIGKLHLTEVPGSPNTWKIGGFVIGENHQDSQQGQLLLSEVFMRLQQQGCPRAVAITASQRAQSLFRRLGGSSELTAEWQAALLDEAVQRYAAKERHQVQLLDFDLQKPGNG